MEYLLPGVSPEVKINGRCKVQNPLPLFWTASGFEIVTDSSELYIDYETDYNVFEEWVRIEIDGFQMIRTSLSKSKGTLAVFRGMVPGVKRHVQLYKEVQPMRDDESALLLISEIRGDGEFYPVPAKKMKIEFVGDSLTSGEGLSGARNFHEWNSISFSSTGSYTGLTAVRLDADYRIISQSGWGVYCSWDNVPHNTLPAVYEQYCSVMKGRYAEKYGAGDDYDFTSWQPDVVVINLGTNDGGAFMQPAWMDPDTGISYKQDHNDGGISTGRFEEAVRKFLVMLRKHNPDAWLMWAYGMVTGELQPYIEEAIVEYRNESGDERVSLVMLPGLRAEWIGANEHPGPLSHAAAADMLTDEIRKIS